MTTSPYSVTRTTTTGTLGNVLWLLVAGGAPLALGYAVAGLVLGLTIIGIPFAIAAMRLAVYAALTVLGVRVLSVGMREGYHPVRSRVGWQVWATERLMDAARNYLFPLYASLLTPVWLRVLGATVGRATEISTALMTPKFTVIEDGAFLADDTMVASYELGGGWIHVARTVVGKRAFLGNSGITQPGHYVTFRS